MPEQWRQHSAGLTLIKLFFFFRIGVKHQFRINCSGIPQFLDVFHGFYIGRVFKERNNIAVFVQRVIGIRYAVAKEHPLKGAAVAARLGRRITISIVLAVAVRVIFGKRQQDCFHFL